MTIYVVTYCPFYAEYSNQISVRKAFKSEEDANSYIENEKESELEGSGNEMYVGTYEIEEIEFVE